LLSDLPAFQNALLEIMPVQAQRQVDLEVSTFGKAGKGLVDVALGRGKGDRPHFQMQEMASVPKTRRGRA
jgi:hypothetical protein